MKLVLRLNPIFVLAWLAFFVAQSRVFAQGTAFTYQGQLQNSGSPASGTYNLQFTLYTNSAGSGGALAGPVTTNGVFMTNGLFTVTMDFGAGPWNGHSNWLEIAVETNHALMFTTLTPLQELTPVPYAIFANTASNVSGTLSVNQVSGTLPLAQLPAAAVTNNETSVTFKGAFITNSTFAGKTLY